MTNVVFVPAKVLAFCGSAQTVMLVFASWKRAIGSGGLELEGAELLVDNLPDDFVGGHGLVGLSVDVG